MPLYGFGRDHASNLTKVARREGYRKKGGTLARYPEPLELNTVDYVQVWATSGSPTAGDVLAGNANNLFPGRVRTFPNGSLEAGATCWLGFCEWYDADVSQTLYSLHGKHFLARLAGEVTSESSTRPFYVATQHNFECWCKPDADIAAGSSGTVSLYNDDFTDSTINRASTLAKFIAVKSGKWCLLTRTMGTYIVQPAECQE
jgi:hypothetical protein